eukprot:6639565-Ditylum_brightwellii.AAC.1
MPQQQLIVVSFLCEQGIFSEELKLVLPINAIQQHLAKHHLSQLPLVPRFLFAAPPCAVVAQTSAGVVASYATATSKTSIMQRSFIRCPISVRKSENLLLVSQISALS